MAPIKRARPGLIFLAAILAAIAVYPAGALARAYNSGGGEPPKGKCGENLIWEFHAETGTLVISGTGGMYGLQTPGFDRFPPAKKVVIMPGVETIGEAVFKGFSSIREVYIPGSVEYIGLSAFWGCAGLERVELEEGVKFIDGFTYCSSLREITLPESIVSIGNSAFEGCPGLISVKIPAGTEWIGERTFANCGGLKEIGVSEENKFFASVEGVLFDKAGTELIQYPQGREQRRYAIPGKTEKIGDMAFMNTCLEEVSIPASVKKIGYRAFSHCAGLSSIELPDSLESISSWLFAGSGLKALDIPDSVKEIGCGAFWGCKELESVVIPGGVERIEQMAFSGCTGLLELNFPEGIERIERQAFGGCTGLKELKLPEGIRWIEEEAFSGCAGLESVHIPKDLIFIGANAFLGCTGLKEFSVAPENVIFHSKDGVLYTKNNPTLVQYPGGRTDEKYEVYENAKRIDSGAFRGNVHLKEINFPDGFGSIESYAFAGCTGLESIFIPERGYIWYGAFSGCTGLKSVVFSDKVSHIGHSAFEGCTSLREIVLPSGLSSFENSVFSGCTGLERLRIPGNATEYTTEDGVLFNKDKTALILYPPGKPDGEYTVPAGVKSVGERAFADCRFLKSVLLPEGLLRIGASAFKNCAALERAPIPGTVIDIEGGAFAHCAVLAEINLPEGIKIIGSSSFANCAALKSVSLPEGLLEIGASAFKSCAGLESVAVPGTVILLGERAFADCTALKEITVSPENEHYADAQGVLFNREMTLLLQYPAGAAMREYSIPDSTAAVGNSAFSGCTGLETLHIPPSLWSVGHGAFCKTSGLKAFSVDENSLFFADEDGALFDRYKTLLIRYPDAKEQRVYRVPAGVTKIESGAFAGQNSLEEIRLPESLRLLGAGAFSDSPSLKRLVFDGDAPAMDLEYDGSPEPFTIYYREGAEGFSAPVWMGYASHAAAGEKVPEEEFPDEENPPDEDENRGNRIAGAVVLGAAAALVCIIALTQRKNKSGDEGGKEP